jgi:integrase
MKKYEIPESIEYRYVVQKPAGAHKSYRILKRFKAGGYETIKLPSLDAINQSFKSKAWTSEQTQDELGQLVERLYREDGVKVRRVISNNTNQALLDRFFEKQYAEKDIQDRDAAYNAYRRAVEAIGELSLAGSAGSEIAKKLRETFSGNAQRRRAASLDQIRRFDGITNDPIPKDREQRTMPRHLTEDELNRVLLHIDSEIFRIAARVAFGTGARIGELCAINEDHYNRRTRFLFIRGQIGRDGSSRETKNRKERRAIVLEYAQDDILEWFERKEELTHSQRINASRILKEACKKAFPNKSTKHCVFHDLRHSYVKFLLDHNVDIFRCARLIGDGLEVTEKHYAGWIVEENEAMYVRTLIDKPKDEL